MPSTNYAQYYKNENREVDLAVRFASMGSLVRGFATQVVAGSFTVDSACVSGSDLEVGTMIADEFEMEVYLTNNTIQWVYNNNTYTISNIASLEGTIIYLQPYISTGSGSIAGRLYKFYIDDVNYQSLDILTIHGYSDIVTMDVIADDNTVQGWLPCTLSNLFRHCFTECGLTAPTVGGSITNYGVTISEIDVLPDGTTYRQLAIDALQAMGANLVADGSTYRVESVDASPTVETFTNGMLFNRNYNSKTISVTGVMFRDSEGIITVKGTTGYLIDFSGNIVISKNMSLLNTLQTQLVGLTYTTCDIECINLPYITPTDWIVVSGQNCFVTNITYSFNSHSVIESQAESGATADYVTNKNDASNSYTKTETNRIANTMWKVSDSEEWVFTLLDDTTVTKTVAARSTT